MAARVITLGLLIGLSLTAFADTLIGKFVKVADGDSITVLDNTNTQHRIRLQGIDAPERKQSFGNASRKHLASLVAGKKVTVKWDKRDRYGRIVGFVFVDGKDINLVQLKAGATGLHNDADVVDGLTAPPLHLTCPTIDSGA